MYAEPPRQYDSSNWKASCLPRGGGPKDKSWVKGKSIRSLPCRLSSRSFFFFLLPFFPLLFYFLLFLSLSRVDRRVQLTVFFQTRRDFSRLILFHPFPRRRTIDRPRSSPRGCTISRLHSSILVFFYILQMFR